MSIECVFSGYLAVFSKCLTGAACFFQEGTGPASLIVMAKLTERTRRYVIYVLDLLFFCSNAYTLMAGGFCHNFKLRTFNCLANRTPVTICIIAIIGITF